MFAVIKTGGRQYRVSEKDTLRINKLDQPKGQKITFTDVLLVASPDGKMVKIGRPIVSGAKVEATLLDQGRLRKIRVVKYKPKIRYHKVYGHRQPFSLIKIDKIVTA